MSASLVRRLPVLLPALVLALSACEEGGPSSQGPIDLEVQEVSGVGFENPGAVIADTIDDVYLVSNIVGAAGDRDGSGFISRLSPEGEVLELNWIDLTGTDRALRSPQGMAIRGDTLFVADMDCVRFFGRDTGEDLGYTCLDGVTHITDVDVGPEGSVFVVDSGREYSDGESVATGTDAVYRLVLAEGSSGSTLARDADLGAPHGIAVGNRGIFIATSESGEIFRLTPDGTKTEIFPPSDRSFGSIVFLSDGGFAFSSWGEDTVFLVTGEGAVLPLMDGLPEIGGLGYDPGRDRVIVPLTGRGDVLFLDMPSDAAATGADAG